MSKVKSLLSQSLTVTFPIKPIEKTVIVELGESRPSELPSSAGKLLEMVIGQQTSTYIGGFRGVSS